MEIKQIKLTNFGSYKNETIEFPKNGVYLIIGKEKGTSKSNGSGKSTICDSINFALYNIPREGEKSTDSLIRLGTNRMEVKLDFTLGTDKYSIKRIKTLKTNAVKIFKNGKDLELKIRDTQDYINTLLGADYKIFKNAAYFKQGDMNAFSKLGATEAKQLLMKILQLSIYSEYESLAKEKAKELFDSINIIQTKIEANKKLVDIEDQARFKINKNEIKNIEKTISTFVKDLAKLSSKQKAAEKQRQELLAYSNEHLNIASGYKSKIIMIEKRLVKLNSLKNKCPLCESVLNPQILSTVKDTLKNVYMQSKKLYNEATNSSIDYANRANKMVDYSNDIAQLNDKMVSFKLKLTELNTVYQNQNAASIKLKKIKGETNSDCLKLESIQKQLSNYEQLIRAFGKDGIQSYIVENVLPEMETMVNSLLKDLNANLRVLLEGRKTLKSGKTANTLEIKILDKLGERAYYSYSGGEKTLIDFALRISLAIILARRANAQIQTLMLDECFNMLDSVSRDKMVKAIKYVQKYYGFKKIILISHQEEALDEDFNIINVIKDDRGSHILRR